MSFWVNEPIKDAVLICEDLCKTYPGQRSPVLDRFCCQIPKGKIVGRFVTTDTSVLTRCGERVRREAVHRLVEEAFELGITKEELLRYIQEEGGVEDEKTAGDPAADGGNA